MAGAISRTASRIWLARAFAVPLLPLLLGFGEPASVPATQLLWPKGAPESAAGSGAEKVRLSDLGEHIVSNVHAPSVTIYLPTAGTSTGFSVIVIPGGGHSELWMDHEGYRVAEFLANHGIAAFVLKYRLAREKGSMYAVEGDALADVQRAVRWIRSQSKQWQLDPKRVGVMGFSAGGELAALAASRVGAGVPNSDDLVERQSSRPNFQALLYPSVPAGLSFSPQTPPAFLLSGSEDQTAISQGLAQLYLALRRAGAHAELHLYEGVGHGFGLRAANTGPVAGWPQRFLEWLSWQGIE